MLPALPLEPYWKQTVPGNTEVLGYFYKTTTDAQRRYSAYDLALLSMYCAVKYVEYLLLDKSFIIHTDNKSLVNSFSKPSENHTSKQVRQLPYLSQFHCTLRHLPGVNNAVADCLSLVIFSVYHIFLLEKLPVTLQEIASMPKNFDQTDAFNFTESSSIVIQKQSIPGLNDPLLVDISLGTACVLLLPPLKHKVIHYYHNLNHLDIRSTRKLIWTRFSFKHMNTKIKDFVHSGTDCQGVKTIRLIVSAIASIPMPNKRFERVN